MKSLGASDVWINLLAALPSLVGVVQIPGGILGRGAVSFKRFVAPGGLLWRAFYVPLIALPLLPLEAPVKLAILAVCVTVASVANFFVAPVYNDWIAELAPANSRGFFFARRNAIAGVVGAAVGIFGAIMLDSLRVRGYEKQGFAAVYALAILCAVVSFALFLRMGDLLREHPMRQTLVEGVAAIKIPFQDRQFRPVLIFLALSVLGQVFPGNLFIAYARESLGLDYKVIQLTAVMMAAGNIAAAAAWGFLVDKYGTKPMMFMAGLLVSITPTPWILCQVNRQGLDAAILLPSHFFMGIVWAGVNLCQFSILLATCRPADRGVYIGAAATITAAMGGIAPLLGGVTMEWLRTELPAANAYRVIFAICCVLRLTAVAFILPIREYGSAAVKEALKDITGLTVGGVRVLRTLTKPPELATREAFIERAGQGRVALASDEIIKALHDPLPRVRRRAALALARLDDPRAVHELIHQIQDHPDLLEEEAVVALGTVGDLQAVGPLLRVIDAPRPLLRRAAARALGAIASRLEPMNGANLEPAIERLVAIAHDPADPDLRRSALQALRFVASPQGEEAIVDALLDQWPSVRIAAAEAVEDLKIRAATGALRKSLVTFEDEACAEVAYALAVVGNRGDIALILREAARSVSMITRRRCLLGVAHLLNVEPEAYRLLLSEATARDLLLQERLKPLFRKNPALREALTEYSSGDEAGALRIAAEAVPTPEAQAMAAQPVEELFVVATLWLTKPAVKRG